MDVLDYKSGGTFVIAIISLKQHQSHLTTWTGCILIMLLNKKEKSMGNSN